MKKTYKLAWLENVNILISLLAMLLPIFVFASIFINKNLIYVAFFIWLGVPIADYIYRNFGGKGLNENGIGK